MPTWDELLKETEEYQPLALFDKYVRKLAEATSHTVICYMSAFTIAKPTAPSPFISIVDQDMEGFMTCAKGTNKEYLDLIIHSPGGDYEATKRIINYLHETYRYIRAFIPHLALSGGTLMACAADEIYMGPYSSLGPTDPQVLIGNRFVPVGAIISEFKKAFGEVSKKPETVILWRERIKNVPIGLVESLQTMQENSLAYLKELLKKRNCRDKKDEDIEHAAKILNSYASHTSHGRGISLKQAQEDLKLNVKDIRQDPELEDGVLSIYHVGIILFQKTPAYKIIGNNLKRHYIMQQIPLPKIEIGKNPPSE